MINMILNLIKKYIQLIRYFVIGVSAAIIDFAIFFILFNFYDWKAVTSTIVSITAATIWAFSLNAFYNFKIKDNLLLRLAAYSFVSVVGMGISTLLLFIFTDKMGL